jgi:hypothetical protein
MWHSLFQEGVRKDCETLVTGSVPSADEVEGKAGTNYRRPAIRKGARGPTMLHMCLSVSVVSLFVDCTN